MGNAGDNNPDRSRAVAPAAAKQDLSDIGRFTSPMLAALPSRIFNWSRSGIGPRLLAAVLLFSSIVTLTLTALQLYLDYDREVGVIETRLEEVGRSTTGSLGESLWNLDQNQLKLQLNGILRLPSIRAAEIREIADRPNPIRIAVGERSSRSVVARDYPLTTTVQGTARAIGVLHVEATLSDVYQQLLNRALVILASQAAKTFLVSLFIIYMVHILVTRHLVAIAEFVSKYSLARPPPPLHLERRPPYDPDELDKVIDAFNAMCANLGRAYGELREANANLERDLKIRRRAEEDARASEQRFRDYAETASDWFWETGPDHVFTYISERAGAFGMDREALIGKRRPDAAFDHDAEAQKWRDHMATLDRHEPFRKFEYRGRDGAGRLHYFSVNGQPVFAEDGRFMGYRGSSTDLTSQHETEERLRQSQKMDAIGQLTGGVAHDFNNVLTVITGTIEIIQEGLADKPELAAIAQLIDDAAARGAEITSQLLTFARRQPLEPREIDVNGLVVETAKLLRPILGEHVEIVTRLADDAWLAMADPSQLSSAIVNLAVNARDAMPDGGRLTLETANRELDSHRQRRRQCRLLRHGRRGRHRSRYSGRHPRPRVRAVLHHQGGRPRHRTWSEHGLWLRQADRWHRRDRERGGPRHGDAAVPATIGGRGGGEDRAGGGARAGARARDHPRGRGRSARAGLCHRPARQPRLSHADCQRRRNRACAGRSGR